MIGRGKRFGLSVAALALLACGAPAGNELEPGEPEIADELSESAVTQDLASHAYAAPAVASDYYAPPTTNAVFVSAISGNDENVGSETAPFKTIARALTVVNAKPAGPVWTISVMVGTYREGGLSITRDNVTLQRYKSDDAKLMGSLAVTGFAGAGPFTKSLSALSMTAFEQSCADTHLKTGSYDFGADTALGVIRNGAPLRRVQGTPASGQYAYNPSTKVLTLADSPTNIEVTQQIFAMKVKGLNSKVAGLTIQNYGSCTVDWSKTVGASTYFGGALLVYKDSPQPLNATIENSVIANNSGGGVVVAQGSGVTLTGNRIVNNGWNGLLGSRSDKLVITKNSISFNNMRRWTNFTEGGMKLTKVHDGVVFENLFEHNAGNGMWFDQGCGTTDPAKNWFIVARNLARYNDKRGIFYEVSHHGMIVSNVVHDNGNTGIGVFGSRYVQLWNNTVVDNLETAEGYLGSVSLIDDVRCFSGDTLPDGSLCSGAGLDPLVAGNYDLIEPRSVGPLANTGNAEQIVLMNNIIAGAKSNRPLLNVEDPGVRLYGAARIVTSNDYQAYWRPSASAPSSLIDWQTTAGKNAIAYPDLNAYKGANAGREAHSVERTASTNPFFVNYAAKNFQQSTSSADVWGRGAALPPEALKAVYWPETAPSQPSARIGAVAWYAQSPVIAPPPPPVGACALSAPVYGRYSPSTGDSILTLLAGEAASAASNFGYTTDRGTVFRAASATATGLVPVYRLSSPSTGAHLWTANAAERDSAKTKYGFTNDEGIGFYASPTKITCTVPVYRLLNTQNRHYFTVSDAERSALVAQGWTNEGIMFYAAP